MDYMVLEAIALKVSEEDKRAAEEQAVQEQKKQFKNASSIKGSKLDSLRNG